MPVHKPTRNLYYGLVAFNLTAWGVAFGVLWRQPVLLGVAALAYSLGLRHAVDADHIAAIDNVTRKLMQAGQRPVTVGLFFSLGHSTVVVLISILLAIATRAMTGAVAPLRSIGSFVGTVVSVAFLFAIAIMNLVILGSLCRSFERARMQHGREAGLYQPQTAQGPLTRLLRPLFRLITQSWQMYPLGVLFGLGFDTATEIGVLAIAASQATKGMPLLSVLIFPILFAAGMSLIDTLDSTLMVSAYGWAFINPLRKLYYNIAMTTVSIAIALMVGTIEALGLLADRLHGNGLFWATVNALNDHLATLGYLIVVVFALSWVASVVIYRLKGYERG